MILRRIYVTSSVVTAALFVAFSSVHAQGGAPMITNDGGTPGNGHWEIDIVATGAGSAGARTIGAPDLDLNYGIGSRVQIKYETAYLWETDGSGSATRTGLANSTLAVKLRLRDDDSSGPSISVYPHLEVHNPGSHSYQRGLVGDAPNLMIPLDITHQFGALGVDTEIAYNIVSNGTDQAMAGLLLGVSPSKLLDLMGELYGTNAVSGDDRSLLANVGTRIHFTPVIGLIMSGGHTIATSSNEPGGWIAYAATQLTF